MFLRGTHLGGMLDRSFGLFFKTCGAAVPELRIVVGGVDDGRGVSEADAPLDANSVLAAVREKPRRGMWQVAQATVPSADIRFSKKSIRPSSILGRVIGLSSGTGTSSSPRGGGGGSSASL